MTAAKPSADTRSAVLLVNLGTPDAPTPAAVRRYLSEEGFAAVMQAPENQAIVSPAAASAHTRFIDPRDTRSCRPASFTTSPTETAMRRTIALIATLLLACFATLSNAALAGVPEEKRAGDAVSVLDKIMRIPEQSVPQSMLDNAYAIAVIPGVVKAGFVVGGRFGRGLISVRNADGTWSNPSYVTIAGGSFGFQAGLQSTDVVLVFSSPRGVDSIVHGKFTLGADASVAAGPVGRTASASTDAQLKAEIYSYSRARGLFAGVALDGAVLAIDDRSNAAIYGRDTTPRAIFEGRVNPPPATVVNFRDRLEEYSANKNFRPGTTGAPQQAPAPAPSDKDNGPAQPPAAQPDPVKHR